MTDQVPDLITSWLNRATTTPLAVTWPIFGDGGRSPTSMGSAVLLRAINQYVLLTANHVLLETRKTGGTWVGLGRSIVPLQSKVFTLKPDSPTGDDPWDLAVCFPEPGAWPGLPQDAALDLSQLIPDRAHERSNLFALVGFPSSKQPRQVVNGSYTPNGVTHAAHSLTAGEHKAAGYSPETHILIEFDKEEAYSAKGRIVPPDPVGMSGGGIWLCPPMTSTASPRAVLAAVATTWHKGTMKRILGTRIRRALELVAAEVPATPPSIGAILSSKVFAT